MKKWMAFVLSVLCVLVAVTACEADEPEPEGVHEVGAYGWDIYQSLDRLPELSVGTGSKQSSSFDRTGGNRQDGFDGTYSYLRRSDRGWVIAEHEGAGEIQSLWFTRDGGNVRSTGYIIFELDGVEVLNVSLQELVDGRVGEPFVYPFVANADESSGGVTIKVPMPFRESMVVTTTSNPYFYHLSYRTFTDGEGVETFDPAQVPTELLEASTDWGYVDPKPAVEQAEERRSEFALPAGESVELATIRGSGVLRELSFAIPELEAAPPAEVVIDDGRAFTGSSAFTVQVDPENEGVVLTRRYDSISTRQRARVLVDGELVAEWTGQGIKPGGWVEEELELPASATAGKASIRITNEFVSAGMDFSEFRYFVDSVVDGKRVRTDEVDIGPFVAGKASEEVHDYVITGQRWEGDRVYVLPTELEDDEAILRSDVILEDVYLVVRADGELRVDAPLGEYHGSGLGQYEVRALMYSIHAEEGVYTSWWPMPYAEEIRVELHNRGEHDVESVSAGVIHAEDAGVAGKLRGDLPTMGYFYATHHKGTTTLGKDWVFLKTEGQGRFMGVNHTMDGLQSEGNTRGYLEGDERFYVDGMRTPTWHGTGTEDLYEGGWYFNRGPFTNPLNGAPATEAAGMYGTAIQSDAAYRLLIGDAIDFYGAFEAGIEPGGFSEHRAVYSSTAFWYGHEDQPVLLETDRLDIGDASSENAHRYENGDETMRRMESTFEGNDDEIAVTAEVQDSLEPVRFEIAVHPANVGVRIHRMGGHENSHQAVEVWVDGEAVGVWLAPTSNIDHRWIEDGYQIPVEFTAGRELLKIELVPVEGAPAWSAARYTVHCIVPRSAMGEE